MDVDSSNTDPHYWDKVLQRCGLSMSRGKHLKTKTKRGDEDRNIIPVGGTAELDAIAGQRQRKQSGKVSPSGHGPDE